MIKNSRFLGRFNKFTSRRCNTQMFIKLLNVALRKTDVINWLLLRVILTSKKEKKSVCSNSEVNLMFGCLVFM